MHLSQGDLQTLGLSRNDELLVPSFELIITT